MDGYFQAVNRLSLDKGIPPLSFEKMPFFWFVGYMEDYLEEIKLRKKEQQEYDSKNSDGNFWSKVRSWSSKSNYKQPKMR